MGRSIAVHSGKRCFFFSDPWLLQHLAGAKEGPEDRGAFHLRRVLGTDLLGTDLAEDRIVGAHIMLFAEVRIRLTDTFALAYHLWRPIIELQGKKL